MKIIKINEISKLGKFVSCKNDIEFNKNNIIFGFNGMGKSTLSSIFYSMTAREKSSIIEARKTLKKKTDDPDNEVKITLETNEGNLVYDNKQWNKYPLIYVFDSKYVDDHLFFDTDNPERILDENKIIEIGFGNKIVKLRKEKAIILNTIEKKYLPELQRIIDQNYNDCKIVYSLGNTKKINADNDKLLIKLSKKLDLFAMRDKAIIEKKLKDNSKYEKQMNLLKDNISILRGLYLTNLTSFISSTQINNLLKKSPEPNADEIFEHINKNQNKKSLKWLIDGFYLTNNKSVCPYCGQNIKSSDSIKLINAIQKFASSKRNEKAKGIQDDIKHIIGGFAINDIIESIAKYSVLVNKLYTDGIISLNELNKCIPDDILTNRVNEVLNDVMRKLWYKVEQVFHKVELNEEERRIFQLILILQKKSDMLINLLNQKMDKIESKLIKDKEFQTNQAIFNMSFSSNRIDLMNISKYAKKINDYKGRLSEIEIEIMEENDNFQFEKINIVLKEMNIGCKLLKRKKRFYIKIDGYIEKPFDKGEDETVKYLLSEGENKALAFAYFLVELELHKGLGQRIIVIDDPICSMDMNRKSLVASKIASLMNEKNNQIFLLSHDITFIEKVDFFINKKKPKKLILGEHRLFDEFSINDYLLTDKDIYNRIIDDVVDQDSNSILLGLMSIMPLIEVSGVKNISKDLKYKSTYFKHTIYASDKSGTKSFNQDEYSGDSINRYLLDAESLLGIEIVNKFNIPLNFSFQGFDYQEALELYEAIETENIMDIRKKAMVLRVLSETVLYKMLGERLNYSNIGECYKRNIAKADCNNKEYAERLFEIYNHIKKYQHGAKGASTLGLAWISPKETLFFDQEIKEIIEYLNNSDEEALNLA